MNPIALIARREMRERVKAKSFKVATALSIAVVVAAIVIPAARRGNKPKFDVAVLDAGTTQIDGINQLERSLQMDLRIREVSSLDEGRAGVRSGRLDVLVIADDEIVTLRRPEPGDGSAKARLILALEGLLRLQRVVAAAGPGASQVVQALQTPVEITGVRPPEAGARQRFTAFLGVFLLFVFLQQYGAWVLTGVIEEKSSRVVEVLLAVVRPRQLVAGKVIGIGAVGLAQGVLVALAAVIAAQATDTRLFAGTTRYSIAWSLLWFVAGYGLYAWVYACVGSLASRQEDAQNAAFPLMIPVLVGYFAASTLLGGGDPSWFVRLLSLLPPTAPMVMPMLIGLGKAPAWHIALSLLLVAVTIVAMTRVAGGVYSRAILHSGRRLKLREVLRGV